MSLVNPTKALIRIAIVTHLESIAELTRAHGLRADRVTVVVRDERGPEDSLFVTSEEDPVEAALTLLALRNRIDATSGD